MTREEAINAIKTWMCPLRKSNKGNDFTNEFINAAWELAKSAMHEPPRVHAHWISLTDCSNAGVYCSNCLKKVYKEDYTRTNRRNKLRSDFCPNCGAIMGEERKGTE